MGLLGFEPRSSGRVEVLLSIELFILILESVSGIHKFFYFIDFIDEVEGKSDFIAILFRNLDFSLFRLTVVWICHPIDLSILMLGP